MHFKPTLQEPTEVAALRAQATGRRSELLRGASGDSKVRAELRGIEQVLQKIDAGTTTADAAGFALARSLWGSK